jgi:hypothetical protein
MAYRLYSEYKLESDWLPTSEFSRIFDCQAGAIATAIEGVDDPEEQQVLVIDIDTGETVWDSTQESYQ